MVTMLYHGRYSPCHFCWTASIVACKMGTARPILPRLVSVDHCAVQGSSDAETSPPLHENLPNGSILPSPQLLLVTQRRELEQLRRSHAALVSRVERLSEDIISTQRDLTSERSLLLDEKRSFDSECRRRVTRFSKERALKALEKDVPEFVKNSTTWCRGNAVVQTFLKSDGSDCTLHEFRLLAAEICKQGNNNCTVFPSKFYALFGNSSRYEIMFHTFLTCAKLSILI